MDKIELTELGGNKIEITAQEIRRYRGTGYGTYIEMNSGTEFRVKESFDEVDRLVDDLTKEPFLSPTFKNKLHI